MGGQSGSETGQPAPRETVAPQVEYRPFSDLTPDQLAELTGGSVKPQKHLGTDEWPHPFEGETTIEHSGWTMHVNAKDHRKMGEKPVRSVLQVPHFEGFATPEYQLDGSVVVTDKSEPGVITLVSPTNDPVEGQPRMYDWVRLDNGGVSTMRAPEGSAGVTDVIRTAAQQASTLRSSRPQAA